MVLTIRPATRKDAEYIGSHLRPEDEQEVLTASGLSGSRVVPMAWEQSSECYSIRLSTARGTVEEQPSVIFGITPSPGNSSAGIIWLLSTEEIRRAPLSILREAREWVDYFTARYSSIYNIADERNDLHIRWIQLLGFTLGDTYAVNGQAFRAFYKTVQE